MAGEALVETLIVLLQEKAPCQSYHGEDEDEKDEQDHDEVLIDHVTDLLSAIAKAAGPSTFEPIFRRVVPNLLKFNQPNRDAPDRLMAIGTIGIRRCMLFNHYYISKLYVKSANCCLYWLK